MSIEKSVRIYDLAKELKQNTERLIEELRREGADVSVPSNAVSKEFAEKVRNRYFPKTEIAPRRLVKIAKVVKNEIEHQFIDECQKMTFDVLEKYLNNCLEKLNAKKNDNLIVPRNKKTYDKLISILNDKIIQDDKFVTLLNLVKNYWDKNDASTQQRCLDKIKKIDRDLYMLIKLAPEKNISLRKYVEELLKQKKLKTEEAGKNEKFHLVEQLQHKLYGWFRSESRKVINWEKVGKSLELKKTDGRAIEKSVDLTDKRKNLSERELLLDNSSQMPTRSSPKMEKLLWTILPKGEWLFENVLKKFRKLSSRSRWIEKRYDENRLKKIELYLNPNLIYEGVEEFEGYIVCCFDWTEKVILECPFYGNATYVIKDNWQEITKVSKWEARYKYSNQVTVINHSETWIKRLKLSLIK